MTIARKGHGLAPGSVTEVLFSKRLRSLYLDCHISLLPYIQRRPSVVTRVFLKVVTPARNLSSKVTSQHTPARDVAPNLAHISVQLSRFAGIFLM
jgi:hypothetical protein